MGRKRNTYTVWLESQKERDYWEDLDVDGDNIKMDLRKWNGMVWAGFIWLRIEARDGVL
jgi:hypothetical protein